MVFTKFLKDYVAEATQNPNAERINFKAETVF
jgi:hypothetical protein